MDLVDLMVFFSSDRLKGCLLGRLLGCFDGLSYGCMVGRDVPTITGCRGGSKDGWLVGCMVGIMTG